MYEQQPTPRGVLQELDEMYPNRKARRADRLNRKHKDKDAWHERRKSRDY